MANETTVQSSHILENQEADECRENIPPGVTAAAGASKLKVQVGDVVGYSSTQPGGENKPLSDTYTFSTPAPTSSNGGVKSKSRLSGLQSALTPILKYLNIGNKSPSPEPLKNKNNPFPLGNGNCQSSSHHPNSAFLNNNSVRSSRDTNAPVCLLEDEYLPEITLLDVTCDSTMQLTRNDSALPDSVPATPVTAVHSTFTTVQPSQLSASTTAQIPCPQTKTLDLPQSNACSPKVQNEATSVSKNTAEASLVMKQPSVSCDVKDICLPNNTFDTNPCSKQIGTRTLSKTSSSGSHKSSPPGIYNATSSPKDNNSVVHPPELSKHNGSPANTDSGDKMVDPPESTYAPLRWLDDRYFPEITLLDVTHDSELSPGGERSTMEVTQHISPVDSLQNNMPSSEQSGQTVAESGTLDMIQSEELSRTLDTISSFNEQSGKCVGENIKQKASLEETRDISMSSVSENSRPSIEPSGQNVEKIETSAEDTPVNVTHDLSSSSDMSVQCAASQVSTSDIHCNTSSKTVASELHGEPVVTSNDVDANNEEPRTTHDAGMVSPSPKTSGSVNGTFNVAQSANLSASTNLNLTAQLPCPQNKTLELPSSNVNSPKAESDAKDQSTSLSKNIEASSVTNLNCSAVKPSGSRDVQNGTFDSHSLQKSSGNSLLGEAATFSIQNNTFDAKPPSIQNGTITLSETSSNDSHQITTDKSSPPKVCKAASSPKDNNSEVHPPEVPKHSGSTASTDPDAKMADAHGSTFEANPPVAVASGAGRRETKDHSQSGLPMTDSLSDTLGHQSTDTESNKANTFNLDDTLDLGADSLITSTPMTNCKMFNFNSEREEGKILIAQKKLYGDGPCKPGVQAPSDGPSNIIGDRKTFLTKPAAKSLLPPSKAASQLLKYKPASALPGRLEPMTTGLPMTRQRTQAEALRSAAAPDALQMTTGISSSYNLRATTTGSKQPIAGLRKPQLSGIPSGIQRAAPGLRPPSAKSNAPASSSTDKLRAPTATNTMTKVSQAKKHPLSRSEAPQVAAKRKKMDAPLPPGSAEASASSCDAANRAKTLKQPTTSQRALPAKTQRDDAAVPANTAETTTSCEAVSRARALKQPATNHRALLAKPQAHGCANCVVLDQQLKTKCEEIRRLKEELLKYRKEEEEC